MSVVMGWMEALRSSLQESRGIAWGVWWNVGLLVASVVALPFVSV
jgi:hypothetical protein